MNSVNVRTGNRDTELIASLRDKLDHGLRSALGGARRVALVNYPNQHVPGDAAIWLGTRKTLARLGVRVAYQCSWDTFSPTVLRRKVPDGPVLINGGGNFGDVYIHAQQELREKLLRELRGVRLIQLPQNIHFRDTDNLDRVRRLIGEHGNFLIMVRDHQSHALARKHFEADVRLMPDMAFGLGELPRLGTPDFDLTWMSWLPSDPEYADHGGPPAEVRSHIVEWNRALENEPSWRREHRLAHQANTYLRSYIRRNPDSAKWLWRPFAATYVPVSQGWLDRGRRILGSGHVLVTGKLHGHVMAILSGIPHVVLDNGWGKVSGIYEAWTKPSMLAHWATDGEAAREIALDLLTKNPPR